MPSPSRIFRLLTNAELAIVRAETVLAISKGEYTSTSGAGKSGTKQRLSIDQKLIELDAEYRARNMLPPRISKVYQNFVRPYGCGCRGFCSCGGVTFDSTQVTWDSTEITWDAV